MNFNSLQYLLFLPVTLILYFALPRKIKNLTLLIASFYFYACWQPAYALLMLFSIAATYLCGRLIGSFPDRKKLWLALCFGVNLAILFFFKYFNFASLTLCSALEFFGVELSPPTLNVLLPVGISFYTFQALGYTVDVYRGDVDPEKNFIDYALFVSFFPQLVAGPIERTGNILPQLKTARKLKLVNLRDGMTLILWGLMKKMIIADNAATIVNTVYNNVGEHSGKQFIFATVAFAIQIYCDFSAYSDIARGSARLLDIELMKNFDCPYGAQSIKDFWRRWHISLSTWFKDYLYFPLGGSRKGKARTLINLVIVFLVSGLWHGAAMTFVAWGLLHGIYQVIGALTTPLRKKLFPKDNVILGIFRTLFTFALVCLGWVLFRANSLSDALVIFKEIFTLSGVFDIFSLGLSRGMLAAVGIFSALLLAFDFTDRKGKVSAFINAHAAVRCLVWFILLLSIFVFGYYGSGFDPQDFVYFQF